MVFRWCVRQVMAENVVSRPPTQTIDLVAQDVDGGHLLVMVEDRRCGVDLNQESQLREKINTYAGYVLDGRLARRDTETADGPVRTQLDCAETPSGRFTRITDHAAKQLAAHGIDFQANPAG
ncbi:hypothetical protein [Jiangella muralis]|uniref:hypothetical protein n=1 Tax=Jiangella muralis TaxID=702383 RepID=UPI00069EF443|nr:hypothetical protein [Jiangella muralis]